MAAIQYLIPGGGYVNETTNQYEFLLPGDGYLNETSTAGDVSGAGTSGMQPIFYY